MKDFNEVSTEKKYNFIAHKVTSYPTKAAEAEDFEVIISK